MRLIAGILCGVLAAGSALAGSPPPVQVMVLGTWHLDNPGLDVHNVQATDVLVPARQAELASVAMSLAAFRPTIVAVERVTAAPGYEDDTYRGFSAEQLATQRDERVQIGYRLARLAGLSVVHGIDEQPADGEPDYFPFDKVQASVRARGQEAALGELMAGAGRMVEDFGRRQAAHTMAELLLDANGPHSLADPTVYYDVLGFDAGEDQPAAELLGYWFMRNAKIFSKLRDVVQPGDRVVVVFGAGHKHWLEQLVRHTPGFELVEVAAYLQK